MLYNGNLTNGTGALKVGWGPYLKVAVKDIDTDKGEDQHQHHGDTVVIVEYKETAKDIKVILHHNGKCLGTAFQIPIAEEEAGSLSRSCGFLPCISARGIVTVQTRIRAEMPVINTHPVVHLEPAKDGMLWNASIHVENFKNGHVQITPHTTVDSAKCSGGYNFKLDFRVLMISTMMGVPPLYDVLESNIVASFKKEWCFLKLTDDQNMMRIYSDDGYQCHVATCTRDQRSEKTPCTSYD